MTLILVFALFVIITSWTVGTIPLWLALCNTIIGGFVILLIISASSGNRKNTKNNTAKDKSDEKDLSNSHKPEDYM